MAISFSSIASLTVVPAPSTPAGMAAEETTETLQPETQVQASTVVDTDIQNILQDFQLQQQNYGEMMVICCGLIIGILLCGLIRWWR